MAARIPEIGNRSVMPDTGDATGAVGSKSRSVKKNQAEIELEADA
jgi:hypothetical protein